MCRTFLSLFAVALICTACLAQSQKSPPKDFDECVALGNAVRESAPPVCVTKDGMEFPKGVKSFEECVAAGYPIMKTYPPGCVGPDGKVFIDSSAKEVGSNPEQIVGAPMLQHASATLCVDKCGDGECAEMVCMAEGCPCPETPANCPQDCKG